MKLYICIRTVRWGDDWIAVAGPFGTHREAEEKREKHEHYPGGDRGHTYASGAKVISRSQLARLGIYPLSRYGDENLRESLRIKEDARKYMEELSGRGDCPASL